MVGKCLYESAHGRTYAQHLPARLAKSFLAQLVGLRVHYKEPYLNDVYKMYAIFYHLPCSCVFHATYQCCYPSKFKIKKSLQPLSPSKWTAHVLYGLRPLCSSLSADFI